MKEFKVTFQYSEYVFCTNIAIAENEEVVKKYYSSYEWSDVKEATSYDIEEAKRKNMPIVTIEESKEENTEEMEDENMEELKNNALEMLRNDEELFVELVNELDAWNGFADGYRAYPMDELDELFCDTKLTDFLNILAPDFNLKDEYFTDTIYGISSTNDIHDWYLSHTDEEEVLENVINNFNDIYIYNDEFKEVVEKIINYDNETE